MKQQLSSRFPNIASLPEPPTEHYGNVVSHQRNGSTVRAHTRAKSYMVHFDFENKEVTILPYSQRKLAALGFELIGDESRIAGVKLLSKIHIKHNADEEYGALFYCSEIFHGGEKRFYRDRSFSYHDKGLSFADAAKVAKRLEVIARDPRKTGALRNENDKALQKEWKARESVPV